MKQTRGECLTAEQISFYNDTGYLVLENHLELDVIQNIRDEIARLELLAVGMTNQMIGLISKTVISQMCHGSGG